MEYLIHYGIKRRSGRFPWGSGKRPFQSGGGPVGKAVRFVRKKKTEYKRNESLKKARAKAAENRKLEANKKQVLKSGSATDVMKYRGKLTNQELSDVVRRLELEKKISNMAKEDVKTGMQKVNEYMKTLDTITNWASTGTKAWNQIVDIYNATPEGRRRPLNMVTQSRPQQPQNQNQQERDREREHRGSS